MNQVSYSDEDRAFERLLLSAGRADSPPLQQTEAALLRFGAGISTLHSTVGSGMSAETAERMSPGSWARLVTAAKWAGLGFMAGGLAMFGWLQHPAPPAEHRASSAAAGTDLQPTAAATSSPASPELVPPVEPAKPSQGVPARARQVALAPGVGADPLTAGSGSDLTAEVAALDGIRTALSIGAWRDAEQQSESYRRTFPQGALRSEAEVLAIEGLMGQGREQAARRAGERFISSHPHDPQVARVRAVIESP